MEALHRSTAADAADDGVSMFVRARPRMFAAALRTLRDAAEAEDIVQDAWLRWQNTDRGEIRNAPAFLRATTVRLAINRATGARTRHEQPLGATLAEPVDPDAGPGALTERGEALEGALLLLLEKLPPPELAAYLLREAFNYSYARIAQVTFVRVANARQLATRARKRLIEGPRTPACAQKLRRLTAAFIRATQKGDFASLEAVLAADVVAGGRRNPVRKARGAAD